jgi:hypothetical protein
MAAIIFHLKVTKGRRGGDAATSTRVALARKEIDEATTEDEIQIRGE